MSGGAYPTVGLAAARKWREEVKAQLSQGLDPSLLRKMAKEKSEHTFQTVALAWFASRDASVSERYQRITLDRCKKDLFPFLGDISIDELDGATLLACLRKIEERGAIDLAHRLRVVCGQIFKFAIAGGLALRNPSSDIAPAMRQKRAVQHRAKVMPSEMGSFLTQLANDDADDVTHWALRFTILTWVRTQETRFAQWSEFEGLGTDKAVWRIPAIRMKMSREHLVPLSAQAASISEKLKKRAGESPWVFPLLTKSGVISENRMLDVLYRMGFRGKATVHGFRGTASTWANESEKYSSDVIELALAHVERNDIRGAYNSAQLLTPRRRMMQDWAKWLDAQELASRVLG